MINHNKLHDKFITSPNRVEYKYAVSELDPQALKPSFTRRASTAGLHGLTERRPVDLNPIRASIAATPESSEYTSIKLRIEAAGKGEIPKQLAQFEGNEVKRKKRYPIPFAVKDYIELVEWSRPARWDGQYIQTNAAIFLLNYLPYSNASKSAQRTGQS